ncbi:hypothetical protein H6F89_33940 [Cyanobacteria bacterium FACHB-63]|nr:hypothetical protein [Cyanobacteria bacterium FACHB-63]
MTLLIADGNEFDLATEAYKSWCESNGSMYQPPSKGESDWEDEVYVLRNSLREIVRLSWDGASFSVIED